jgi:tetratricopeptide (TPR) repeat protein
MRRSFAIAALAAALVAFAASPPAGAAGDDGEVLVPAVLRPADADPAAVARTLINEARMRSDARLMGRAEAILAPLIAAEPGRPDLLVLRATIRQWDHDFAGALADYAAAIAADPQDPQARISRAFAAAAAGDLAAAGADCRAVPPNAGNLPRAACHARVLGLSGEAARAHALLSAALAATPSPSADLKVWALTILADLSSRLGDHARAVREAEAALALAPGSETLAVRLAAIRLAAGRAQAAFEGLAGFSGDEAILLRAKAGRELGLDVAADLALLGERFAAAARDGGVRHLRFEADLTLLAGGDLRRGLDLALRNFARSKEPEDIRAVLRLAAAAGDPAAAGPALAYREATRLEDAGLDRLAATLTGGESP